MKDHLIELKRLLTKFNALKFLYLVDKRRARRLTTMATATAV